MLRLIGADGVDDKEEAEEGFGLVHTVANDSKGAPKSGRGNEEEEGKVDMDSTTCPGSEEASNANELDKLTPKYQQMNGLDT